MSKTKAPAKETSAAGNATGTYRYDRERGEIVLVSAGVPKVASKGKTAAPAAGHCGRGACGGGRCRP